MNFKILLITILLQCVHSWVPPGMNSYQEPPHTPSPSLRGGHAADQLGHGIHLDDHDHDHKKEEVADMILDGEHIREDFGELYKEEDIQKLELEEQLFLWFKAHDWDEDDHMDGLELLKALSHDHNYHHSEEHEDDHAEVVDGVEQDQHTPAVERQRLRRTIKIVDKILEDNDTDHDGLISFPEFYNAFKAGNMDGLKVKRS